MKPLRLTTLTLLLLSVFLSLAAQSDPAQSGYIYDAADPVVSDQASSSIFLCSDNSVIVFSNWDVIDFVNHSGNAITKLDPQGSRLWRRSVSSGYPMITGVDVDEDDCATFIFTDVDCCQLYKISSTGVISEIGEPVTLPSSTYFHKALRTSDGDIVAIGRAFHGWSSMYYCWTYCHFSAQGEILATASWYNSYSPAAASSDIALMDNGNLLISCALGEEGSTILEITVSGDVINRYDIHHSYHVWYGLNITKEPYAQSHILAYDVDNGISIDRFSDGSLEHLFSIPESIIGHVSSMLVTPDNILICGPKGSNGVLVMLDWTGNVIWTRDQSGANLSDYAIGIGGMPKSLLALDDAGCIYWAWGRSNHLVVVKLLPNGQVANQDEVQVPAANLLAAYPNPMKSHLAIKTDPSLRDDSVNIYNIRGELMRRLKLSDGETLWDGKDSSGHDCPSGIYILRSNNERSQVKKISKIN